MQKLACQDNQVLSEFGSGKGQIMGVQENARFSLLQYQNVVCDKNALFYFCLIYCFEDTEFFFYILKFYIKKFYYTFSLKTRGHFVLLHLTFLIFITCHNHCICKEKVCEENQKFCFNKNMHLKKKNKTLLLVQRKQCSRQTIK